MDVIKWGIEHVLYPAMERRRGNRVRPYTEELKRSERLSTAEARALTADKLKALLLHCVVHVPAYREFAGLAEQIEADPFSALLQFPLLTKQAYMACPDDFLSDTVQKEQLILNRTGGSTGEPVKFYMDRKTVEYYEAARWRGLSWRNVTPGSRSVMIWGNPFELSQNEQRAHARKERFLKNRVILSAYDIDPKRIDEIVRAIDRFRPEYLYGYPSPMTTVAELMLVRGLRLRTPLKVVVSTAETLTPAARDTIEAAFGAPVANEYGARDAGILAYECPEGGMHISSENVFLEVVHPETGEPLPSGEFGVLLATDLNNFSQPRLRYRLGDTGILSDQTCSCGRSLPLIESLEGREDSMFVRTDGGFVHGNAFTQLARALDCIARFQVVQKSPELAVLNVVLRPGEGDPARDLALLVERASALLPGTELQIERVNDIPLSGSGKFRSSIREF
ncbi:phenylacetate--CoA ligase family protein [Oscillospiraceae bacterium OttesenSCG-928-G22]|nr:phenylacetate--CoA ligase family protein [Oscillospiraceae bacterium OttesenSCG-928-G22]